MIISTSETVIYCDDGWEYIVRGGKDEVYIFYKETDEELTLELHGELGLEVCKAFLDKFEEMAYAGPLGPGKIQVWTNRTVSDGNTTYDIKETDAGEVTIYISDGVVNKKELARFYIETGPTLFNAVLDKMCG